MMDFLFVQMHAIFIYLNLHYMTRVLAERDTQTISRKTGRPIRLTGQKEENIVQTVMYNSGYGVPLARLHLL